MGATATQYETGLNSSSGRHEGYYVSKANQTVRIPSGEQFEFLAEELINVEYPHKVCLSFHVTPGCLDSQLGQFSEQDTFTLFKSAERDD